MFSFVFKKAEMVQARKKAGGAKALKPKARAKKAAGPGPQPTREERLARGEREPRDRSEVLQEANDGGPDSV